MKTTITINSEDKEEIEKTMNRKDKWHEIFKEMTKIYLKTKNENQGLKEGLKAESREQGAEKS